MIWSATIVLAYTRSRIPRAIRTRFKPLMPGGHDKSMQKEFDDDDHPLHSPTGTLGTIVGMPRGAGGIGPVADQSPTCGSRRQLYALGGDEDGDFDGDAPKDQKQWRDPSTLILATRRSGIWRSSTITVVLLVLASPARRFAACGCRHLRHRRDIRRYPRPSHLPSPSVAAVAIELGSPLRYTGTRPSRRGDGPLGGAPTRNRNLLRGAETRARSGIY
jgi:hypothetical protein